MLVARDETELRQVLQAVRSGAGLSLVPTMGALHDGHLALVAAARASGDRVIASIFVNPLQFNQPTDFARYPIEQSSDLRLLEEAGCAAVWLPSTATMYPAGHATRIAVGGPARGLEADHRPGHFEGVATVVAILLGQVRPDVAWFGEKDWQQFQVIRRLIADLRLPVLPRAVPTVRAADGLALSSRNRFLSPEERRIAPALHAGLKAAAARIEEDGDVASVLADTASSLTTTGFAIEYLVLADAETLVPVDRLARGLRLLVAAKLGSVRLLDNLAVG